MFNFLFDGKLGDILAPVVPQNQVFLAIQHFKNAELNELLNTTGYNPATLADGGYAALHVACRYNNRFAVEILLSRGVFGQYNLRISFSSLLFAVIDRSQYAIDGSKR
jgi:ankyrin repeat protein